MNPITMNKIIAWDRKLDYGQAAKPGVYMVNYSRNRMLKE
jgi:hypothetical protein